MERVACTLRKFIDRRGRVLGRVLGRHEHFHRLRFVVSQRRLQRRLGHVHPSCDGSGRSNADRLTRFNAVALKWTRTTVVTAPARRQHTVTNVFEQEDLLPLLVSVYGRRQQQHRSVAAERMRYAPRELGRCFDCLLMHFYFFAVRSR